MPLAKMLEHGGEKCWAVSEQWHHEKCILFAVCWQNKHEVCALQASAKSFTSDFNMAETLLTVLPLALQSAMGHIALGPYDLGARVHSFLSTSSLEMLHDFVHFCFHVTEQSEFNLWKLPLKMSVTCSLCWVALEVREKSLTWAVMA